MTVTDPAQLKTPKRQRLVSVTTLCSAILSSDSLVHWAERESVNGVATLVRAGEPVGRMNTDDILHALRESKIGAEGVRDAAARRGVNVHALLERYLRDGYWADPLGILDPDDFGYAHALNKWLAKTRPDPISVEEIVADPEHGYAGRLDAIIASEEGRTVLWDLKTSEKAQVFDRAHLQTRLYARAVPICGGPVPDEIRIVVVAKDGTYREMDCLMTDRGAQAALHYYRALKPVTAACVAANRTERAKRAESAPDNPVERPKVERVDDDPSTHPGAFRTELRRELPDGGVITFEESPVGWTTKDGYRRGQAWRAYWWQPPVQAELPVAA
jgi:hypothetical protein